MAETATIQHSNIPPPYKLLFGHNQPTTHNITKQSSPSSTIILSNNLMDSKPSKPSPVKTVNPKSLVKTTTSTQSALPKPYSSTKLTSSSKPPSQSVAVSKSSILNSGSSSIVSNNSTSVHSARVVSGRKSSQLETTKSTNSIASTTPKSFRKPPSVPNLKSSYNQSLPPNTPTKTNNKFFNTTSSRATNSARNSNTLSARSNVSVQSPVTPSRQSSTRPQTKVKDVFKSNSLVISNVPSSQQQPTLSSRSTSSTSSTSSQFNSLLISNSYDDEDDSFIVPETKETTSTSSRIAKQFNLTLNLSCITNNPCSANNIQKNKTPSRTAIKPEPLKKDASSVESRKVLPTSSTSPTRRTNILHGGITSSTTLPRAKKTTPRTSNIVLEQNEENNTIPSITNSVDILSARTVVDGVIFNKSPSQTSASSSPKPTQITSPNQSEDSPLATSRSKQSSIYDELEEFNNFEDKEIAILQQSFSKPSRTTSQAEKSENFWTLVDISHTCILYESEKLYKLFCSWISEEQEQEMEELYSHEDQKLRRDEIGKLKANSCVIYEEAFCQIVQYFLQLACKFSDDLIDHWCEFNCLDFFDFLDVRNCGAISKESVFLILCLISSQICRKLSAFLETFGDTLFEFCRPYSNKSLVSKTVNIHMTRKLAFICNIDDVYFTKAVCKLGFANSEILKKDEVFKIYAFIFSRYDKGTLTEKEYFIPPMVTPIEDKYKAPISARTFGNISSRYHETPNSSSTLTYASILVETKSHTQDHIDTNEEVLPSDRTPKVVYSSSKKITFPIRNNSNTQLVDTLSNDIVKNHSKDIKSQTEFIEEKNSARELKTDLNYIEQSKDAHTTNNGKGNKYLIESPTPITPINPPTPEATKKKKKRWKCCVM